MPAVSNNSATSSNCFRVTVHNGSGRWFWNDPGLHQVVRITSNNYCFNPQVVAGGTASTLHINPAGADCLKIVYPDATENQYAIDEPCSPADPLEQFVFYFPADGGNVVCLKQDGSTFNNCVAHGLAVSADLDTEIVGAKQQGPFIWDFIS